MEAQASVIDDVVGRCFSVTLRVFSRLIKKEQVYFGNHGVFARAVATLSELPKSPAVVDRVHFLFCRCATVWQLPSPMTARKSERGDSPCVSAPPPRDRVFHVLDTNIVLHVGEDVASALPGMIQVDSLLMGRSTFHQMARIPSKSISVFSMEGVGENTPRQYGTNPPQAVAERGHLRVPIEGSWRNPALISV